jgi:SWIM zinc finger
MATASIAQDSRTRSREDEGKGTYGSGAERAIEHHKKAGEFILRIGTDCWYCPSQDTGHLYTVREGETEDCNCPDWQHRGRYTGQPCVHIYTVAIEYAKRRRKVRA